MTISRKFLFIAIATVTLAACGKGDKDKAAGGGGDKKKDKAPPAAAWIKVDKLGVQLEMASDTKADPGAGDSFMISSPSVNDCTVMLDKEKPDMMESYDKVLGQIKEAKMGNGKLKSMKKEEKGADGGWKLVWESEGMDPKQTSYGVNYRVMIDGAAYGCVRNTSTPEGQACVAKACDSLKKL